MILLISALIAFSAQADVGEDYAKLCEYDNFCQLLKEGDEFRPVRPEISQALAEKRDEIITVAKGMGVKPAAVAGAILADYTLTPDSAGSFSFLSSFFGGSDEKFDGHYIKLETAIAAENHLATQEKRAPKSKDVISKELKTSQGAIYYTAAVMRQAQDVYRDHGFDISGDPRLLATLYNLGKYQERAEKAKTKGTQPRYNFFGYFQQLHAEEIQSIASSPEVLDKNIASGRNKKSALSHTSVDPAPREGSNTALSAE